MNRIDIKFKALRKAKKKAFIAFITAGDPNLKTTKELVLAFEKAGVDIVELGVPFSDPLADGPTIQSSSQRALQQHVTLEKIIQLVKDIRRYSEIPIALMTYYNPVFAMGEAVFVKKAAQAGVDGVIIPDLPPEEGKNLIKLTAAYQLAMVQFLSPTTTLARTKRIIQSASGFIYFVSVTGVTGARTQAPVDFMSHVKKAQRLTKKPICVGFGVSTPQQVQKIAQSADGVIVGSAIINQILQQKGKKDLVKNTAQFVRRLTKVL
ncbi:MAG: tryptophan synthase subunit alpha [Candidatus Omnitrophica bacterium]|nr:tryptophan synthase subunit alpha [Candidatus Omnitrophota bacterium]MCB9746972.1 tryptophan synthase subunit alpha [Candidatus Omnitrophota bacterium]